MKRYIETKMSDYINLVGIHCSPYSLSEDSFHGNISYEYYMSFQSILEAIKHDYNEANMYISQIESLDDGLSLYDDSADLIYDIESFFNDNNIEWIFVSIKDALTKYGDNCYYVYFDNLDCVYIIDDELTENAKIYIYNSLKNKPKLRKNEEDYYI